jgi:thioredoxin reductase
MSLQENGTWDCVVVGGGAAGLSAALVLGRARQRTLVVDDSRQSNRAAHGVGGLLGHDGRPPAELYANGRAELAHYPAVEVRDGTVTGGARIPGGGFALALAGGERVEARHVVLATGMDYRHRELPGAPERWGRSVFHCPFCHGWEVRDRPLAVLDADPEGGVHRALLLRRWSDDVTLLTDGPAGVGDEAAAQLARAGVTVDERPVAALRGPGEELEAVVFADGSQRACAGLLLAVTLHARDDLGAQLGATAAPPTPLSADALAVDAFARTDVPGLLAAGDVTGRMPSVANAIAAGAQAAASVVQVVSTAV